MHSELTATSPVRRILAAICRMVLRSLSLAGDGGPSCAARVRTAGSIPATGSMKLNFKPTAVAFLDFETQSEADLKDGAWKYMRHPSTKALTCVVRVDGVNLRFDDPHAQREQLFAACSGRTVVAHNAPFDAGIWEQVLDLLPVEWFDTLPCARAAGLPGGLDKLSLAVGGRGKDKNGERLIKMLCILKPGQRPPVRGPAHELLMDYNVQDVEELELVYDRVKGYGGPDVIAVDRAINDRGIPVDRDVLYALRSMYDENAKKFGGEFKDHTDGVNPKSPKQVREWLLSRGVDMPSIGKPAVQQFLGAPEEFYSEGTPPEAEALAAVKEAIELRREMAGVGRGKVDAACRLVDTDDRIRDQFVYYGTHTGRWTSRGLQLHNMPSATKGVDIRETPVEYAAVVALAAAATAATGVHVTVSDCLNIMLKRIVRTDNFLAADYGAVEARCVAWVSGDERMLAAFSDPKKSIYIDMGSVVFQRTIHKKDDPREYILSKALVLGCGYGMSGAKFEATCRLRESRSTLQVLEEANINLPESVKLYRKTYPRVVAVWKEFGDAVHSAVDGVSVEAGRCFFCMVGRDLHAVLPSGRPLVYRNARKELRVPAYCRLYGMPEVPVPTVVYDGPRSEGFLYGGKVCENMCQAICGDLIADALVKSEQAGLSPFIHVHDEVVCAAPEGRLNDLLEIMSVGPPWAEGFPILVEGYSGPQWSKHSSGYLERTMVGGRIV